MAILLTDDGTLDTVAYCDECGEQFRGNYEPAIDVLDTDAAGAQRDYDDWVTAFIQDIEEEHGQCCFDENDDVFVDDDGGFHV